MRQNQTKAIALGGLLAGLAMVIMCLVGLIPVATFICPMLCILLLAFVKCFCGNRIGWAWYGAVAIMSILMAPDKEAALCFVFLGYYPLIKPELEKYKLHWLYKLAIFQLALLLLYGATIRLFGMQELLREYEQMGRLLTVITVILGNITFLLMDKCLTGLYKRKKM